MQIEYDTKWLKNQRFEVNFEGGSGDVVDGIYHITDVIGIGSSGVVFVATDPNGRVLALKMEIPRLSFYIRELPADFKTSPPREVSRVSRKLLGLIGDPLVDLLIDEYELLYSNIVESIYTSNVSSVDKFEWEDVRSQVLMDFVLRTPGFRYRIQDWATEGSSNPKKAEWASNTLRAIDHIAKADPDLQPEELLENPFYILGGADMNGLLTDDELPEAISFLRDQFGSRSEGSEVDLWLNQCWIIGNLLQDLVDAPGVARFVKFHSLCHEMLIA